MNSTLSFCTICLTICRLATRASAIFANFGPKKTNSTMLGLVTSLKMMMVVGVLNFAVPQIVPPNEYLTIPGTPVVNGQVCCFDASCDLLEYKELVLVLLTFVDLPIPFSLPSTLVFSMMVLPVCSSQDFANESDSHICLSLPLRSIVAGVELRDVVQEPDPCVGPVV